MLTLVFSISSPATVVQSQCKVNTLNKATKQSPQPNPKPIDLTIFHPTFAYSMQSTCNLKLLLKLLKLLQIPLFLTMRVYLLHILNFVCDVVDVCQAN